MFKIGFKKFFFFCMLVTGTSSVIRSFADLPREKRIAVLVKLYTDLAKQDSKAVDRDKMLVVLGLIEQTVRS